ncbi:Nedd8-conjugating enzyme ubc-12 [Aphelenchoides bicaudatus]|nr:Nedd8-conjugating enzyme ubc-12 [Aphelenchoides bicaudatus]
MFNLQQRRKGVDEDRQYINNRVAVRDKLLSREFKEIEDTVHNLPCSTINFPNPTVLYDMVLTVKPNSGMYRNGVFKFSIVVPPEYNNAPPVVKCLTRIWHPNINEDGAVCLSLLRQNSLDGMGWMPTRGIKDVIIGLDNLFGDLMDFDDPLNNEAAEMYNSNKDLFSRRVAEYISKYCR